MLVFGSFCQGAILVHVFEPQPYPEKPGDQRLQSSPGSLLQVSKAIRCSRFQLQATPGRKLDLFQRALLKKLSCNHGRKTSRAFFRAAAEKPDHQKLGKRRQNNAEAKQLPKHSLEALYPTQAPRLVGALPFRPSMGSLGGSGRRVKSSSSCNTQRHCRAAPHAEIAALNGTKDTPRSNLRIPSKRGPKPPP